MRHVLILILVFSINGCVRDETDSLLIKPVKISKALTKIDTIKSGMTKKEVKDIMGDRLVIGYRERKSTHGAFESIYTASPQRIETINVDGQTYSINYYFTKVFKSDGLVSEEELTPVIFKDDIVVGKGWNEKRALEK